MQINFSFKTTQNFKNYLDIKMSVFEIYNVTHIIDYYQIKLYVKLGKKKIPKHPKSNF